MQIEKTNIVNLGQVRRAKNFAAFMTAPWKASLQLGNIWANYAFGVADLTMKMADLTYKTNMQLIESFQNAHASYSIYMNADAFFEHLPIKKDALFQKGSFIMGRVLMPGERDDAPARQLSDYQELKLDVQKPGEKFSIYFGSRNGNGARYNFDYDGQNVILKSAYSVHDFNKKYESLHDVVRETTRFSEIFMDFLHHIRVGAEQKMLLSRKDMPKRDLGSRDHLTLVEI